MKPNEALAANLKKHFERNDITANALGKSGKIPQKTVWSCLTGTIAPSVNTVFELCKAVDLDASIITRKEFEAEQIRHSKRVGLVADDLMTLSFEQIKFIADVVKGLMPDGGRQAEIVRDDMEIAEVERQPAIEREAVFLQAAFEMGSERRMTAKRLESNRQMTFDELNIRR